MATFNAPKRLLTDELNRSVQIVDILEAIIKAIEDADNADALAYLRKNNNWAFTMLRSRKGSIKQLKAALRRLELSLIEIARHKAQQADVFDEWSRGITSQERQAIQTTLDIASRKINWDHKNDIIKGLKSLRRIEDQKYQPRATHSRVGGRLRAVS